MCICISSCVYHIFAHTPLRISLSRLSAPPVPFRWTFPVSASGVTSWGNATTVWSCGGMSGECGVVDMVNGPDGYMYMVDLEGQLRERGEKRGGRSRGGGKGENRGGGGEERDNRAEGGCTCLRLGR